MVRIMQCGQLRIQKAIIWSLSDHRVTILHLYRSEIAGSRIQFVCMWQEHDAATVPSDRTWLVGRDVVVCSGAYQRRIPPPAASGGQYWVRRVPASATHLELGRRSTATLDGTHSAECFTPRYAEAACLRASFIMRAVQRRRTGRPVERLCLD